MDRNDDQSDGQNDDLGADEVIALLASSPSARSAILVGGQALNIWAEKRYRLHPAGVMLSEDIDFVGTPEMAQQAGIDWNARVRLPAFDDATPNTALIRVNIAGRERTIDFLDGVLGVDTDELRKLAVKIRLGEGETDFIQVMHPLHCLVSQVTNVYDRRINRRANPKTGNWMAERVRIAIQVLERIFGEYLEQGDVNTAKRMLDRLGSFATCAPAVRAFHEDAIDILDAVPLDHPGWKEGFGKTVFEKYRNRADRVRKARRE